MIIPIDYAGVFWKIMEGTERSKQKVYLCNVLAMMEKKYVVMQSNCALLLWNIIAGVERRKN